LKVNFVCYNRLITYRYNPAILEGELESDVGREYTKSIHTPEISRVRENLLGGGDVEEHNVGRIIRVRSLNSKELLRRELTPGETSNLRERRSTILGQRRTSRLVLISPSNSFNEIDISNCNRLF